MIEFGREVYLLDDVYGVNLKACGTTSKAIPWPLGSRSCRIQIDDGKVGIPEAHQAPEALRSLDLIPLSSLRGLRTFALMKVICFFDGAKAVKPPTRGRGRLNQHGARKSGLHGFASSRN